MKKPTIAIVWITLCKLFNSSTFIKNSVITPSFIESVTQYINLMQETHYSGEAMFRIVEAVEQGGTQWTKDLYQSWRRVLANVGIGEPGYIRF